MNLKPFFLLACSNVFLFDASAQKPNVILIMTDDQGWGDVGFNGNKKIKTPFLDQLASKGLVFNRFYSASAVSSPTRASVLTGRNPYRVDVPDANSGHLKQEEVTLPEVLKANGYTTGHFGKWHLGILSKDVLDANRGGREQFAEEYSIPTQHGYDTFFCTESKIPSYDPMLMPASFKKDESKFFGWRSIENKEQAQRYGTHYWKGENLIESENLQGDNSRVIMDRVLPFVENAVNDKQPFFATIWLHTPHLPVVSDSLHRSFYRDEDFKTQTYYGSITAMDEQIGRLWQYVKERGIADNTVIFFCSDNGPEISTPGSSGVFRERKRSLYEGGVRVPAFVLWNRHIKGGAKTDYPAVTSDYLPTVLDMLNIRYSNNRPIDGVSLLKPIMGNRGEREKPIGFLYGSKMSWVDNRYKYISVDNGKSFELYDLIKDKREQKNIIGERPEVAARMDRELRAWMKSVEKSRRGMDY